MARNTQNGVYRPSVNVIMYFICHLLCKHKAIQREMMLLTAYILVVDA